MRLLSLKSSCTSPEKLFLQKHSTISKIDPYIRFIFGIYSTFVTDTYIHENVVVEVE